MLRLRREPYLQMVGHCYDGLPLEACGLLGGHLATGKAERCYPMRNEAQSSRIYRLDSREYLRVDRDAEDRDLEIIGVFHSHTHTDAYPSPTDVGQAPDPDWHYVLVSLRDIAPVVRSYRIVDGNIAEEQVVVESR
jgi:proteasome lid subunit RPN8/RPN11